MPVQAVRSVTVRRRLDADQPLLESMYDAFEPMGEALGLPPPDSAYRRQWLAGLRNGINLVAFSEDVLAGHLALMPLGDAAEMSVFVHQDYRRRGIGTALARGAVEEARAAGIQRISVFIDTANRAARRGLLQFGFQPVWEDLQEGEYVYFVQPERGQA